MNAIRFDWDTAHQMDVRPRHKRHFFVQDADGSVCLLVEASLRDGGKAGKVPIMLAAIEMLDRMTGAHFIRIIGESAKVDLTAPRGEVRLGEVDRLWNHHRFIVGPDSFPDGSRTMRSLILC